MRSVLCKMFLVLALAAASAPALLAQETTGAIEGVVRDAGGAVLPGATVEATGPVGTVVAVTDERGEYRFPRLPSGRYTVKASLASFRQAESTVNLTVGNTARAEFSLQIAGVTETVQVTAESPRIDLTTPQTATNISRERLEYVPRGRDFTDVVGQAAGASNETQAGGISIDGSSGSENRFIIDGIDTTDPQTGVNAVPMRADFMEEVQVKSAGYAAEFGGSTGGVINAITKSGTNRFSGMVLSEFQQRSWGGSERPILVDSLTTDDFEYINPPKDDETRIDPGFSVGGPILRNKLWFFGSYQPGIRNTERTVEFQDGTTNTFDQDFRVNYGAFNVTGNAGSKLLFRGGATFSPFTTERDLPGKSGRTTLTSTDSWLRGTEGDRRTYSGSVDYLPTSSFAISSRFGRFTTDENSTGVEFPGIIHQFNSTSTPAGIAAIPAEFRKPSGFSSGVLVTDATAKDHYIRDAFTIDGTYFVNAGGEHQIKGGFQSEKIFNDVQTGYNADRIIYYAGRTYSAVSLGNTPVSGTYGYFRLLNISTLGEVSSRNNALFIQDTWRVRPNLTLNFGLRAEQEKVPNFGEGQNTAIEFGWGEKIAPRFGMTWDPTSDGRTKVYGSIGRYYDVMKYEMPRGSFGGDKWVDFFYTWDNPNFAVNTCVTGTNTLSEKPVCSGGTLIEALDRRHNSAANGGEGIEPDLKPMLNHEYQLGISRELTWGGGTVVGARYIRKNLVRTIEDVGVIQCEDEACGEVFYIANPGEGITLSLANAPGIPAFPKAKRDYDGVEFTIERRFSNNWGASGSYTISRLYGNYSGLASSDENGRTSPNVNRFFDSIENSFDQNANLVYGRLGTDRPHQFKGQFMYRLPSNTTLGLNQRIASGIPVSEEGYLGATVPFFPLGRGNLGRTPVLSQTDLSLWQDFRMARTNLQLGVTVLNLFDQDTVTRRYRLRLTGALPVSSEEFFANGLDYAGLVAAHPELHDVKFNQPDQYQAPREVRFTVKFQF
jgi:hypothetical protein